MSYELRQVIYGSYRVLYRVVGQTVEILHVRHGVRGPAAAADLDIEGRGGFRMWASPRMVGAAEEN